MAGQGVGARAATKWKPGEAGTVVGGEARGGGAVAQARAGAMAKGEVATGGGDGRR